MVSMKKLPGLIFILLFLPLSAFAAQVCDGTGDGWTIDNPDVGSTSYTVGCWIYDAATAEDGNVMNYGVGNARGFNWYEYTGGYSYLINMQAAAYSGSSNNAWGEGAWHNVIWTSSGGTIKMYIDATDGTADFTSSATDAVAQNSTDDFKIGLTQASDIWGGNIELSAKLEHCFYANTVLDESEITAIANKSTCPTDIATHSANIKIFLPLTTGLAVTDESSNHFTVTESGNPTDDAGPGSMPTCGGAAADNLPILQAIGEE